MKSRLAATLLLTTATLLTGSAYADSGIKSRNAEDAYNDLMRNYSAAPSGQANKVVNARAVDAAHADLMRDWNAKTGTQPQKAVISQSEKDAHRELMRGNFPLSQYQE